MIPSGYALLLIFACRGDDPTIPDGDTDTDTDTDEGPYFPAGAIWTTDVTEASPDPASEEIIAWLDDAGWGLDRFQIDYGLEVLQADTDTPMRSFDTNDSFYDPDCDHVELPVPVDGRIEGEMGYACAGDGDCHLLVVDAAGEKLYEMFRANIVGDSFDGGCLAVWDLTRIYGENGRGDQCSSADAAGFPIAPLLFSADEVAAGEIDHAIRFVLPNSHMRAGVYVRPATHAGSPSGPNSAPPYGVQLRLRADFPLDDLPNDGARVVARALQKYGMFLSDGGSVALTAQSDTYTTAKWDGLLGPQDLIAIQPADFQVMELGEIIELTYDCVREP